MDIIRESLWLAGLAFDCLEHYWQVSVFLCLAMAGCAAYDYEIKEQSLNIKAMCAFLPLVGSVLILLSGAMFRAKPQYEKLTLLGIGMSFALSAASIRINRATWKTSVAIALFVCWYSLWCSFVAAMSITGRWI